MTMTPHELEHLRSEIVKARNWSYHKKAMYGIALLSALKIPTEQMSEPVDEIIRQLLAFDGISIRMPLLLTRSAAPDTAFEHEFLADSGTGVLHIFHENVWLEMLDNPERTLVLVVTGGLEGELTFYSGKQRHLLHLRENGVFHLGNLTDKSLYLSNGALKIKQRLI